MAGGSHKVDKRIHLKKRALRKIHHKTILKRRTFLARQIISLEAHQSCKIIILIRKPLLGKLVDLSLQNLKNLIFPRRTKLPNLRPVVKETLTLLFSHLLPTTNKKGRENALLARKLMKLPPLKSKPLLP